MAVYDLQIPLPLTPYIISVECTQSYFHASPSGSLPSVCKLNCDVNQRILSMILH